MFDVIERLKDVIALRKQLKGATTETLLYTNPVPGNIFVAGKIEADLAGYDSYKVAFRFHRTMGMTVVQEFEGGLDGILQMNDAGSIYRRNFTYADDGLTFTAATATHVANTSSPTNNEYLIPWKIYGITRLGGVIKYLSTILKAGWSRV